MGLSPLPLRAAIIPAARSKLHPRTVPGEGRERHTVQAFRSHPAAFRRSRGTWHDSATAAALNCIFTLSQPPEVRLGYACINTTLAAEGVMVNRGMIRKTFLEKGLPYASELALKNVRDLLKIVDWNVAQGIRVFRITSSLFPWASEYRLEDLPDFPEIKKVLKTIGSRGLRLTTHPDHFVKLAAQPGTVLDNSIKDLEYHAHLFDLMGLPQTHWHKINIHVGGAYGDKAATLERFAENLQRLSPGVRNRLTVENDDKPGLFSVKELLPLHHKTGIPIVFDYFHHSLHPDGLTEEEAFLAAYHTWDVKPVFHYSSSRRLCEDPTAKKEAHADFLHERIHTYGKSVDLVLESKMKEAALLRYLGKE